MTLLSAILVHLLLVSCCISKTYHVNSSSDLEQYLCNTTWSSQYLVFLLNSSINFTISPGNFCQVTTQQTSRIEIQSNSPTKSATISCFHYDISLSLPKPRRGLVFFNSQVTLKQLVFKNCGTYLTTIQDAAITEYLNSSSLYYTSSHAAVLVFVHCQVNITQVNIYYSYGFAMIGINLYNSTINSVNISNSLYSIEVYKNSSQSIGSGFLLHYMNINKVFQEKESILQVFDIHIKNASFSNNFDCNTNSCITQTYYNKHPSPSGGSNPIVNAAGLTILYTQQNSCQVSVHITESYFKENNGCFAGGMFVLQYQTFAVTNTTITNTVFHHNTNFMPCHGAAIVFYWYSLKVSTSQESLAPLYFFNTSFVKHEYHHHWHKSSRDYGAVFIGFVNSEFVHLDICFRGCSFSETFVASTGACIYASGYEYANNRGNVSITLDSTIAKRNSRILYASSWSIFYFYKISRVKITGTSHFSNNYGSVISSQDSNVYLSGDLTFNNNHAMTGPAIRLVGNCQLYFMSGVIAKFTDNSAQLFGGAIYAEGTESNGKCVIQIDSNVSQIVFSNNEAKRAGSSIYAQPIFSCYINNTHSIKSPEEIMAFYKEHFTFSNSKSNSSLNQFSTLPQSLSESVDIQSPQQIFPGQKFGYCISAIDALSRNVFATIAIEIVRNYFMSNIPKTTKLWLLFIDQEKLIQEGTNCTTISVTVHTNDQFNIIDGVIVFSLYALPTILTKSVKIYPCPLGFDLNKIRGVCELSSSFDNLKKHHPLTIPIVGNVSSQTITRLFGVITWAGTIEYENKTKTHFGVALTCPIGYCDSNHTLPYFYSGDLSSNKSFKLSDGITNYHPPLCLYQHEGVLCGRCSEGLSVVFGSTECHHCSNTWIASIGIYLVAGPLLIYLLFALRLTLTTGTFNGIIFYAQAANVGILDTLSVYNGKMGVVRNVSIVLLSILNLGLGFPLCFYNGMNELWKTCFNLLFPLYLLTIVVVLIILSRYSLRLSNKIADSSVQVLVTVVHLSFGRLLSSIINAFTPAKIFTSEQTYHVWYWDGSVEYGSKGHVTLMIITSLVVFLLFLPYILLLLFAKLLKHWRCTNEYTRPILEAVHAPYKNDMHYWFVARLFLLIIMYTLYSIEPYAQVVYIAIALLLFFFIIGQTVFRPYKSNFVNMLDCWLLFNLGFVYITTWYLRHMEATVYGIIAILLFFMTLFMVLVYHILFITGQLKKVQRIAHVICTRISQHFLHYTYMNNHSNQRSRRLPLQNANDSFYNTCDNFREPTLAHLNK